MRQNKQPAQSSRRKGLTLAEVLVASFLSTIMLLLIGDLYTNSVGHFKRIDFEQGAQQYAGVILETIAREIRNSVRIELPNNGRVSFPIDRNVYPIKVRLSSKYPVSSIKPYPYIAFTNKAEPTKQINFFYHYDRSQCAIFYYYSKNDIALNNLACPRTEPLAADNKTIIKKFASDSKLRIDNFEVWSAPDGAVIRIQVTDSMYTRDYDYATDTARAGDNAFDRRPIIEHSMFVPIHYYN
jgi:hypothetical protein